MTQAFKARDHVEATSEPGRANPMVRKAVSVRGAHTPLTLNSARAAGSAAINSRDPSCP